MWYVHQSIEMYVHQKQTCFTYIFGEDKVGLEVPVSILSFWDPVSEGSVGLIPVDAHVTGCIVDQIVHIIPELPGTSSASYSRKWLVFRITTDENITNLHWDSSTLFLLNLAHDWGTLPLTSSSSIPSWCLISMASLWSSAQSRSISRAASLCSRSPCSLSYKR